MFQFRFEALLSTRRHAEECLQKELAEARRALVLEQTALREKKLARRQCVQEQRRKQRQGFRGPDMLLYGAYLQRIERDIDGQQKRVTSAERKVHQKRQSLIEAVKKRKMLEKLKEKDQENHFRIMAERERRFIDEVAGRIRSRARLA